MFVRAFVDAFVQQKTSDGYEVMDSLVAAQDEGEAAPAHHSPKPSSPTEGEAAGTGAVRERCCSCLNSTLHVLERCWPNRCAPRAEGSLDYEQGSQGQSQVLLQPLCKSPVQVCMTALPAPLPGHSCSSDTAARCVQEPKGQTSIEKLAKHFHLPINAAGRELGICPTVLKKICRKHGLTRWPHRKVRPTGSACHLESTARMSPRR